MVVGEEFRTRGPKRSPLSRSQSKADALCNVDAPKYADKDVINPSSVMLSGAMSCAMVSHAAYLTWAVMGHEDLFAVGPMDLAQVQQSEPVKAG
jgi:hypothetical protein